MKLKRKVIMEKYKADYEGLYADVASGQI